MERERGLQINVGDVLTGAQAEKRVEIDADLRHERDTEDTIASPVSGTVTFIAADRSVIGQFAISVTLSLICSVDAEGFANPLTLRFRHSYSKEPTEDESPVSPDNSIDIAPAILDEILVNIPMKPLCPKHKEK